MFLVSPPVVTTDARFRNEEFSVGARVVCKRLRLQGLCVYINTTDTAQSSFASRLDALGAIFNEPGATATAAAALVGKSSGSATAAASSSALDRWSYAIPPVSAAVHLRMHRQPRTANPNPAVDEPEADIEIGAAFDPFYVRFTHTQYHALLGTTVAIGNAQRYGKYLCYRPAVRVRGNSRQWWKHAIECVVRDLRQRRSRFDFALLMSRSRHRRQYSALYKRTLNSPGAKELSDNEKIRLLELEKEYSFDDVVFFRKLTAAEVQMELDAVGGLGGTVTLRKAKAGFFSRLFGGGASSGEQATAVLTKEQV